MRKIKIPFMNFAIVKASTASKLEEDYSTLNSKYSTLNSKYSTLNSKYSALNSQYSELANEKKVILDSIGDFPPGHFYSTIPDYKEIAKNDKHFSTKGYVADIDFNEQGQLDLLTKLSPYLKECPYNEEGVIENRRYYQPNNSFNIGDSALLFAMLRCFKPKRIIEIGSGFSSALMLDTNEYYFEDQMDLMFIEPYPEDRLLALFSEKDKIAIEKNKKIILKKNLSKTLIYLHFLN